MGWSREKPLPSTGAFLLPPILAFFFSDKSHLTDSQIPRDIRTKKKGLVNTFLSFPIKHTVKINPFCHFTLLMRMFNGCQGANDRQKIHFRFAIYKKCSVLRWEINMRQGADWVGRVEAGRGPARLAGALCGWHPRASSGREC